ncbi:unnamed protein product [Cuscuta campestris]|uniref:Uncharacterized protein n=1 Tax=Cuscuta campestris TaxID=132261 RepID=A0A484LNV2_9ASTE|nr:unnamed protein product [Cuscuta campestris]
MMNEGGVFHPWRRQQLTWESYTRGDRSNHRNKSARWSGNQLWGRDKQPCRVVARYTGLLSISIESKFFDFQSSDSISVTETKRGKSHTVSFSRGTALWLSECLNHPPIAKDGWSISRFEGQYTTSFLWDSNRFGSFVRLRSGIPGNSKQVFIPVGLDSEGIELFVQTLKEIAKTPEDYRFGLSEPKEREQGGHEFASLKAGENTGTSGSKDDEECTMIRDRTNDEDTTRQLSISSELLNLDIETMETASQVLASKGKPSFKPEAQPNQACINLLEQVITDNFNLFQESLGQKQFLTALKEGQVLNFSGQAIRMTRESIKSFEVIDIAEVEGTKYPVFLAYAKEDMDAVFASLGGLQSFL